jgi:hypothetical protein
MLLMLQARSHLYRAYGMSRAACRSHFVLISLGRDHSIHEIQQDRITKSSYHTQMEEDPSDSWHMADATKAQNIRYWSDCSHVYYLPRSIQRVPNSLHWENPGEDWKQSQDQFHRYNEVRNEAAPRLQNWKSDSEMIRIMI